MNQKQRSPAHCQIRKIWLLRPSCVLQASSELIQADAEHLFASRPNHEDVGFGRLSRNEVDRCQAAASEWETRRASGRNVCNYEDLIIHVGDDPRSLLNGKKGWLTWTGTSNKLPCLRRSGGLYVSTNRCRHLTLEEMYGFMGFAALPIFAACARVPMYKFDRAAFSFWDYTRALGNAQHVAQFGVVMSSALASCVLVSPGLLGHA